jgi:hypothetical protein
LVITATVVSVAGATASITRNASRIYTDKTTNKPVALTISPSELQKTVEKRLAPDHSSLDS